jgi:hypothetical protein
VSFIDKAKRAHVIGGIIAAVAGSAQAPADMPKYLEQQYRDATKVRLEQTRRDTKRLTKPTPRTSGLALSREEAKRLRGR